MLSGSASMFILPLMSYCYLWSTAIASTDEFNLLLSLENSTFNSSNFARFRLQKAPVENLTALARVDLQFRTSYASGTQLFSVGNGNNETLTVGFDTADRVKLYLRWLFYPDIENSNESRLVAEEITLQAPEISNGEWQTLTVHAISNGTLVLNSSGILGQLPENFTALFYWSNQTTFEIAGSGFRGCLANFYLDEVVSVPLHSQSTLINDTDYLQIIGSASNLPVDWGCRQASCQCEPNGVCIYRQWDVLDRCNCTRGYDSESYCKNEWDTCKYLEPQLLCLNEGNCSNRPGIDEFSCTCISEFLGSRCQSFNICRLPVTCQNGALCQLTGNVEQPNSVDYNCTCTPGFTGRNCTVIDEAPIGPDIGLIVGITIGVIAILLLVIVAFVVIKVIRDRRRDSGAYRPSHREASRAASDNSMAMGPALRPPLDERLI